MSIKGTCNARRRERREEQMGSQWTCGSEHVGVFDANYIMAEQNTGVVDV